MRFNTGDRVKYIGSLMNELRGLILTVADNTKTSPGDTIVTASQPVGRFGYRQWTVFTDNLVLLSHAREMVDEDIGYTPKIDPVYTELEPFLDWYMTRNTVAQFPRALNAARIGEGRVIYAVYNAWQGWLAAKGLA